MSNKARPSTSHEKEVVCLELRKRYEWYESPGLVREPDPCACLSDSLSARSWRSSVDEFLVCLLLPFAKTRIASTSSTYRDSDLDLFTPR
jgi:hypothetical protein